MYFYVEVDGWAVGARLPSNLQSSLGTSVSLDMDTDKPYEHYAERVKQYPREKSRPGKVAKN